MGLIEYLAQYITPRRYARMQQVLARRTRSIVVAIEDIYQSHNASALLRTCDALGIQEVHIIENRNSYKINPSVELGAAHWLTLIQHKKAAHIQGNENTARALQMLRQKGYRIVATVPPDIDDSAQKHVKQYSGKQIVELNKYDTNAGEGKTVVLFGNELEGISETGYEYADTFLSIPMYGFVESFNISVAAAIVLHQLTTQLRDNSDTWPLRQAEAQDILLDWVRSSIKNVELIEKQYESHQNCRVNHSCNS